MRFLSVPGIPIPEGSWIVLREDMGKEMAKLRSGRDLRRYLSHWKNIADQLHVRSAAELRMEKGRGAGSKKSGGKDAILKIIAL